MRDLLSEADDCIARCRKLALHTEEPGFITRPFLCPSMRGVHDELTGWMRDCGMPARVDAAGNLRGVFPARTSGAPALYFGSHLDTVPRAGAFDGILGVVIAIKLVELTGRPMRMGIEVLGFSEEEGVRFGFPFIGSRALIGELDAETLNRTDSNGVTVAGAIRAFGLEPEDIASDAVPPAQRNLGYIEFHIEQGPVLESLNAPLAVVEGIAGQSRMEILFEGNAGHAGTTPMHLRRDALAGAAEWITAVEREAMTSDALVATVGRIEAEPGATNVIPGTVRLSLDIRHHCDAVRMRARDRIVACGRAISERRGLRFRAESRLEQPAVNMDARLTEMLARAVAESGQTAHRMFSGAGHDAMIIARRMPAAMLFLRTPGGLSHHPDESVLREDVAAALAAGLRLLEIVEASA